MYFGKCFKIKIIVRVSSSSDRTIIMPTKKGKMLCNLGQNDKNIDRTSGLIYINSSYSSAVMAVSLNFSISKT